MQPHDPAQTDMEARKLRFEGRKFALETLTRMYLAQLGGTRNLSIGHVKLTFGLSLGALAGFLTLISAFARFTEDYPVWPEDRTAILLLACGLGSLLIAAVVAILQYRATVEQSAAQLTRPYPDAEAEFLDILSAPDLDETDYLDRLSIILRTRSQDARQHLPPSSIVLFLILIGATTTGISLFMM